jgi:hypothetical protein
VRRRKFVPQGFRLELPVLGIQNPLLAMAQEAHYKAAVLRVIRVSSCKKSTVEDQQRTLMNNKNQLKM